MNARKVRDAGSDATPPRPNRKGFMRQPATPDDGATGVRAPRVKKIDEDRAEQVLGALLARDPRFARHEGRMDHRRGTGGRRAAAAARGRRHCRLRALGAAGRRHGDQRADPGAGVLRCGRCQAEVRRAEQRLGGSFPRPS